MSCRTGREMLQDWQRPRLDAFDLLMTDKGKQGSPLHPYILQRLPPRVTLVSNCYASPQQYQRQPGSTPANIPQSGIRKHHVKQYPDELTSNSQLHISEILFHLHKSLRCCVASLHREAQAAQHHSIDNTVTTLQGHLVNSKTLPTISRPVGTCSSSGGCSPQCMLG
jgi:hypothetical protein